MCDGGRDALCAAAAAASRSRSMATRTASACHDVSACVTAVVTRFVLLPLLRVARARWLLALRRLAAPEAEQKIGFTHISNSNLSISDIYSDRAMRSCIGVVV